MTLLAPTPVAQPSPIPFDQPQPRRWTREEYYRLGEMGMFLNQRAELIEGKIMVLSPQKWLHASSVDRVAEVLRCALPAGFWVRMQLPLSLGQVSDPEPDISVVAGRREDYTDHPSKAVLLVEVSDSTLVFDRIQKASLYAHAGIADYWIVNLVDRRLEVRRTPATDSTQPYGYAYADLTTLLPPATVHPLAAPTVGVAVADLLP